MKKNLIFMLVIVLSIAFSGCSAASNSSSQPEKNSQVDKQQVTNEDGDPNDVENAVEYNSAWDEDSKDDKKSSSDESKKDDKKTSSDESKKEENKKPSSNESNKGEKNQSDSKKIVDTNNDGWTDGWQ